MIEVKLRTNWFGPDGGLYKSSRNPHRFPDDWKKYHTRDVTADSFQNAMRFKK